MTGQQLKNSILQMAVQGKLVPQDPNDEPASVLLERIRVEKEQMIRDGKIKREKAPSVIFRGADNTPYEKVGNGEPVSIADEVPFDIPDSWEWVRLGAISTYAQAKKKVNAQEAAPDTWALDLEDIEKGGRLLARLRVADRKAIGDKTVFEKGDILYSKLRPYLMKTLIADDNGICSPEIVPFKVYGDVVAEYIVAYLQSPYVDATINAASYGIKMPRAGTETMTSLLVPIPPVSEQHRIIRKLRELLPLTVKYHMVERTLSVLNDDFPDQLRKSILQFAVQGKLVSQDPSDEPATVLLGRIRAEKERLIASGKIKRDKHESIIYRRDNSHYEKLDGVERCIDEELPFEIPGSWCWCHLAQLTTSICDGDHQPPPQTASGVPFLVISDVSNGTIDLGNTRHVSPEYYESIDASRKARKGDILFTVTGSYGIVIPVMEDRDFCFQRHIALLKVLTIDSLFLALWLKTPLISDQCTEKATGTAQKTVGLNTLRNLLIPLPPLAEQKRIIAYYNALEPIIEDMAHS